MQKEPIPTPAEIWKILREVSLGQKEMDRMLRKSKEETEYLDNLQTQVKTV